jgi:chemotaxis protein MotB
MMRAQARQVTHEEEEESAFVSMTDMTVGFLFIIMILLAFFASQIRDEDTVSRDLYETVRTERDDWRELAERRAEEIARLQNELIAVIAQRDDLIIERDALASELAQVIVERDELVAERDALVEELALVIAERDDLVVERDALANELAQVIERLRAAEAELAELGRRYEKLKLLVAKLRDEIAEKDRTIIELEEEIRRLRQIDPLEAYLAQVAMTRREVLILLRDAILQDFPDLQVELSEESDALRFQGEGLFASGSPNLTRAKQEIVARLAQRLNEILPCFTIGELSQFSGNCNPGFVMIEAVQIEGHTDIVGNNRYNRILSTDRANSTFFAMTDAAPQLMQHQNLNYQPVLSVAGYGEDRPVATNDTREGRATNRRIDLRFIMVTPRDTDGIAAIREALETVLTRPR